MLLRVDKQANAVAICSGISRGRLGQILGFLTNELVLPLVKNKMISLGEDKIKKFINVKIAGKTVADLM